MNTAEIYRNHLAYELAGKCKMNSGQVDAVLGKFDKLTGTGMNSENAFSIIHESFASSDTKKAVQTIKSLIEKELGEYNKVHPGIDTNAISRLRRFISRHNELVDCASVSINGVDMTRAELDEAKLKVPNFAKQTVVYSATASTKSKGMSLTVVY
jgi:hypothetical protein